MLLNIDNTVCNHLKSAVYFPFPEKQNLDKIGCERTVMIRKRYITCVPESLKFCFAQIIFLSLQTPLYYQIEVKPKSTLWIPPAPARKVSTAAGFYKQYVCVLNSRRESQREPKRAEPSNEGILEEPPGCRVTEQRQEVI